MRATIPQSTLPILILTLFSASCSIWILYATFWVQVMVEAYFSYDANKYVTFLHFATLPHLGFNPQEELHSWGVLDRLTDLTTRASFIVDIWRIFRSPVDSWSEAYQQIGYCQVSGQRSVILSWCNWFFRGLSHSMESRQIGPHLRYQTAKWGFDIPDAVSWNERLIMFVLSYIRLPFQGTIRIEERSWIPYIISYQVTHISSDWASPMIFTATCTRCDTSCLLTAPQ